MFQNSLVLREKIRELLHRKGAAIVSIGDFFAQFACINDNLVYFEAVSHEFCDSVSPGLENSFSAIGFKLDQSGNYSRTYPVISESAIDNIISDTEHIFINLYKADYNIPFEVTDAE